MNKKISISVIIPFKFQPEFLNEALKSIFQQDINNVDFEIIIIQEKEFAINLKKELDIHYPNIQYLTNEYDEGPGGSRQTGLKRATGEYILFLDADDVLHPLFFKKLLTELIENPQASGTLCLSHMKFEKGFLFKDKLKLYPMTIFREISRLIIYFLNNKSLLPSAFYLCHLSHMIFRSSLIKKNNFDYQYRRGGEDWDFVIKAIQKGPIIIVPLRLVYFRHSRGSSTYQKVALENKWNSYLLLVKNLPNSFKRDIFYKIFLKYIKFFGKNYV